MSSEELFDYAKLMRSLIEMFIAEETLRSPKLKLNNEKFTYLVFEAIVKEIKTVVCNPLICFKSRIRSANHEEKHSQLSRQ